MQVKEDVMLSGNLTLGGENAGLLYGISFHKTQTTDLHEWIKEQIIKRHDIRAITSCRLMDKQGNHQMKLNHIPHKVLCQSQIRLRGNQLLLLLYQWLSRAGTSIQ